MDYEEVGHKYSVSRTMRYEIRDTDTEVLAPAFVKLVVQLNSLNSTPPEGG